MTTKEEELRWLRYGAGGAQQTMARLSSMGWVCQDNMAASPATGESYTLTKTGWENMYDALVVIERQVATRLAKEQQKDRENVKRLCELLRRSLQGEGLDPKEVEETIAKNKTLDDLTALHLDILRQIDDVIDNQNKVFRAMKKSANN